MEIAVPDLAGSLGGGGRYDNLVGMFLGEQVPACGFSLGLERILVVMTDRGMFPRGAHDPCRPTCSSRCGAPSAPPTRSRWPPRFAARGCVWTSIPRPTSSASNSSTPPTRGYPFVIVMGDDETARGEVTVKDMKTGEQRSVGTTGRRLRCSKTGF